MNDSSEIMISGDRLNPVVLMSMLKSNQDSLMLRDHLAKYSNSDIQTALYLRTKPFRTGSSRDKIDIMAAMGNEFNERIGWTKDQYRQWVDEIEQKIPEMEILTGPCDMEAYNVWAENAQQFLEKHIGPLSAVSFQMASLECIAEWSLWKSKVTTAAEANYALLAMMSFEEENRRQSLAKGHLKYLFSKEGTWMDFAAVESSLKKEVARSASLDVFENVYRGNSTDFLRQTYRSRDLLASSEEGSMSSKVQPRQTVFTRGSKMIKDLPELYQDNTRKLTRHSSKGDDIPRAETELEKTGILVGAAANLVNLVRPPLIHRNKVGDPFYMEPNGLWEMATQNVKRHWEQEQEMAKHAVVKIVHDTFADKRIMQKFLNTPISDNLYKECSLILQRVYDVSKEPEEEQIKVDESNI